ncbi:DVU_1553 family AMP-dependent CoA ligase [Pseudodesulfovibrio sp.]|uniref:DVU_1553 family AMP-dependent CoA ligase n=1 Tax=Pseudodesulfovibrio sp. TaxID=2035812 RepID=UPI002608178A|nr:AMP-binding protein [Pseudodesulfovibrio sp.]MDD3313017.1 AMP-binding protein [Pseudodesulfovibrio sp.]
MIPKLDRCLARRMGRDEHVPVPDAELRAWQLDRLRRIVAHAKANSPFYARRLAGVDPASVRSFADFARLPFLQPDDLRRGPEQLLCVSLDEIARVVTLTSSGTTGEPKRIFHTAGDLEATTDFFALGMSNMTAPGDTVLVLLPDERPGGVARLLGEALARGGARAVAHPLDDADRAVDRCLAEGAKCVIGSPAHLNLLALAFAARGVPAGTLRSVLLCWDAVPDAVVRNCERTLGCAVFRHWGMIETCLGGGVECSPGSGLHLREADIFLEIVDPATGDPLPDGVTGELVLTTPLRLGMPFIRYRTGDLGRILPGVCPACGSPLRRLDPRVRRADEGAAGDFPHLDELNEVLYSVDGLGDFAAGLEGGRLTVRYCGLGDGLGEKVRSALENSPLLGQALRSGDMAIDLVFGGGLVPAVPGLGKRKIRSGEEN